MRKVRVCQTVPTAMALSWTCLTGLQDLTKRSSLTAPTKTASFIFTRSLASDMYCSSASGAKNGSALQQLKEIMSLRKSWVRVVLDIASGCTPKPKRMRQVMITGIWFYPVLNAMVVRATKREGCPAVPIKRTVTDRGQRIHHRRVVELASLRIECINHLAG